MVYFPAKGFKGCERGDFKKEPCKVLSLSGLQVDLILTGSPPDLFQLSDTTRGNVYKFRTGNEVSTRKWYMLLNQIASGLDAKPLPANLMTFE